MRLSESERQKIRAAVRAAAGPAARVRLFGSGIDDRLRGGDIGLLVEVDEPVTSAVRVEARIGARLQRELGDRRVDVIVAALDGAEQPVHRVARETASCCAPPQHGARAPCVPGRLVTLLLEPTGSVLDNPGRAERLGGIRSAPDRAELRLLCSRMVHEVVRNPQALVDALQAARAAVADLCTAAAAMTRRAEGIVASRAG